MTTPGDALLDVDLPTRRDCTRCDGTQQLLDGSLGMGKYECSGCGMIVGFDLEAHPAEFLLDRGRASRYTKNVFGDQLVRTEWRLPDRVNG